MPDPALLAAHELYKMLSKNGIQTRDGATSTTDFKKQGKKLETERTLFLEMLSPGLSEIIRETNTHSVNLFAEHMLIHCGLKLSGRNKTELATGDITRFWKNKGIDTRGMFLFDGSGLSRANSFTARQMTGILKYMKDSSQYFEDFYESLPVGGKTGTLKSLFKEHPLGSQIRAKSGTIGRVKAYSGYVRSVSGRDLAFSMLVNDFSGSSANATKKLEKLMLALAEFKL
jgi:serine-type D-Ala-D-Ala carboxypeptidase/endopeptidase (penicillin-binding protein 4)